MAAVVDSDIYAVLATSRIPDYMHDAIVLYIAHHIQPGHFLCAVMSNDLVEAVGRADDTNQRLIPEYVKFFYNDAPSECWGSPDKVTAWLARGVV